MILPSALQTALRGPPSLTIALSGGIDSLTLSAAAAVARGADDVTLCHALSPAVPAAATERAREFADLRGMNLRVVDAGEFSDPDYRANPVNRCYFCKTHLYGTLSQLGDVVAAGTNMDDLGDYRPGLIAAREHAVLHPFVDAGMTKSMVRKLATYLGLGGLADLPAAPCLASRIETGLRVEPADLQVIDQVETVLRDEIGNVTLRCRRLHQAWVIEIDETVLAGLNAPRQQAIKTLASAMVPGDLSVTLRAYKQGSAFVHG